MRDITRIEIKLQPRVFQYPWHVVIHGPIYNTQNRFRFLPDALAWVIKEMTQ